MTGIGGAHIDELLRFDPLATAEKLTGKSYKEDEGTSSLGLLMHLDHTQRKQATLAASGDTHFRMPFVDTLNVYASEGFREVHRHTFPCSAEGYDTDQWVILWNASIGCLAVVESYWGGESTNSSKVYFNWRYDGEGWHDIPMSCSWHDDVILGSLDTREGLRHWLLRLRAGGELLPTWVGQPFLWLLDYSEDSDQNRAITAARIAALPDDVRAAIGTYKYASEAS